MNWLKSLMTEFVLATVVVSQLFSYGKTKQYVCFRLHEILK